MAELDFPYLVLVQSNIMVCQQFKNAVRNAHAQLSFKLEGNIRNNNTTIHAKIC